MAGHEISVHTWSHKVFSWPGATDSRYFNQAQLSPLRRSQLHRLLLSWAGLVKLSKKFWMSLLLLCVHPMGILMIASALSPSGGVFDTNDWRVAAGEVTGVQSFQTFQTILLVTLTPVSLFYNMISMKPPLILLSDILLMPLLAIILLTLSRLSVNAQKPLSSICISRRLRIQHSPIPIGRRSILMDMVRQGSQKELES